MRQRKRVVNEWSGWLISRTIYVTIAERLIDRSASASRTEPNRTETIRTTRIASYLTDRFVSVADSDPSRAVRVSIYDYRPWLWLHGALSLAEDNWICKWGAALHQLLENAKPPNCIKFLIAILFLTSRHPDNATPPVGGVTICWHFWHSLGHNGAFWYQVNLWSLQTESNRIESSRVAHSC